MGSHFPSNLELGSMATVPPPPSSGPAWLGEYTPPPKPTKTEKLPPRSQRRSRERRQSSARPPVPLERRESVGGINVWAPPRAAVQEPEVNPESDSAPVKPAVNETESHTPNAMSAPGMQRSECASVPAALNYFFSHLFFLLIGWGQDYFFIVICDFGWDFCV